MNVCLNTINLFACLCCPSIFFFVLCFVSDDLHSHLSFCVSFCPAVYSPTVFVHLPSFTDCATWFKDLFFWDTVFAMWRRQKWTGTPDLTTQSGHFGLWGRRGDDCTRQQLRLHWPGNIPTFKKGNAGKQKAWERKKTKHQLHGKIRSVPFEISLKCFWPHLLQVTSS